MSDVTGANAAVPKTAPADPAKPAGAGPAPAPAPARSTLNVWSFLAIGIVMAAFVAIVWRVLDKSKSDTSTAVFGVIVPVFASIGAAVFGIQAAYQRGNETGTTQATATKDKEVAAARETATTKAHLAAQQKIQPVVDQLGATVRSLVAQVRTAGESPAGTDMLQFMRPSGTPQTIPASALAEVDQQLGQLETVVQGLAG